MTRTVLSAIAVAFIAASGPASELSWIEEGGGDFEDPLNWAPALPPATGDDLVFDITTNYTVLLNSSPMMNSIRVSEGELELDLDFRSFVVESVVIGDATSDVATLILKDGGMSVPVSVPAEFVRIGKDVGSNGTLQILGGVDDSSLDSSNVVIVGDGGTGLVEVAGTFMSIRSFLGDDPGAQGTVRLTVAGATWMDGGPIIGNGGDGTVEILGGTATWTGLTRLADDLGSTGMVTVSGLASALDIQGESFIGNLGSGGMTVDNGATLTTNRVKFGDETGSLGTLTMSGATTSWSDTNDVFVGNFGTGIVELNLGATADGVRLTLGDDPGSTGLVTINDAASSWTLSESIAVGDLGSGSLVLGGGTASAPIVTINTTGDVSGNGTLGGAVTNGGGVDAGLGTIHCTGSYAQLATGELAFTVDGAAYGQLVVEGAVTLGGAIVITENAAPTASVVLLSGAPISGTFTTETLPANTSLEYGATAVTLVVGSTGPVGDLDGDGTVGFSDLLILLAAWGPCNGGECAADLDGSGDVGFSDLLVILGNWGATG